MTHDDQFIGQLEDYLVFHEGETPLPETVRDGVLGALPRTRQVRAWPEPFRRRSTLTSRSTRWGLAAAALVVAVAAGTLFVNTIQHRGVAATPPPSAPARMLPSRTAPPATSLRTAPWGACIAGGSGTDCLAPGVYALDPDLVPATVTFAVPFGWFEWDPGTGSEGVLVDSHEPAGSGWGILFSSIGMVSRDPCNPAAGTVPVRSVDDLVAAMAGWPGFSATSPESIDIDGSPGRLLELTSSRKAATCPAASIWTTANGTPIDAYPMVTDSASTRPTQFRILDVGGSLLVIRTTDYPQQSPYEETQGVAPDPTRHAADQVELRAIVSSITITPTH